MYSVECIAVTSTRGSCLVIVFGYWIVCNLNNLDNFIVRCVLCFIMLQVFCLVFADSINSIESFFTSTFHIYFSTLVEVNSPKSLRL